MGAIISLSRCNLSSCGMDNRRCEEDQEFLLGDILGLVLEQPSENRDSGQIRDTSNVVGLRVDEYAADDHRLPVSNQHLCGSLTSVDARTRRVASRADGVSSGPYFHEDLFTDFFWISRTVWDDRKPGRNG